MATTFIWDNTANVFASNHWGRSAAPFHPGDAGSTTADAVTIAGDTPPADGPAASLTVHDFTCTLCDYGSAGETANLVVSGGELTLGSIGGGELPVWSGDATLAAACFFSAGAENAYFVGSLASFADWTVNDGAAMDHAYFSGNASNVAGLVAGYAAFVLGAQNFGFVVGDFAAFIGGYNDGTVTGEYTAFVSGVNQGTVAGEYTAFVSGVNQGTVAGGGTAFSGSSSNSEGIVGDWASLADSSRNDGGTIGANCLITSNAPLSGTFGPRGVYMPGGRAIASGTVLAVDSAANAPILGGTPEWLHLLTPDTYQDVSPYALVTEIGDGSYRWYYDAQTNGDAEGVLDFGSAITAAKDRYVEIRMTADARDAAETVLDSLAIAVGVQVSGAGTAAANGYLYPSGPDAAGSATFSTVAPGAAPTPPYATLALADQAWTLASRLAPQPAQYCAVNYDGADNKTGLFYVAYDGTDDWQLVNKFSPPAGGIDAGKFAGPTLVFWPATNQWLIGVDPWQGTPGNNTVPIYAMETFGDVPRLLQYFVGAAASSTVAVGSPQWVVDHDGSLHLTYTVCLDIVTSWIFKLWHTTPADPEDLTVPLSAPVEFNQVSLSNAQPGSSGVDCPIIWRSAGGGNYQYVLFNCFAGPVFRTTATGTSLAAIVAAGSLWTPLGGDLLINRDGVVPLRDAAGNYTVLYAGVVGGGGRVRMTTTGGTDLFSEFPTFSSQTVVEDLPGATACGVGWECGPRGVAAEFPAGAPAPLASPLRTWTGPAMLGPYSPVSPATGTATVGVGSISGFLTPPPAPSGDATVSPGDVRYGVNRGDGVLGSCRVPGQNDVRYGVLVDATYGQCNVPPPSSVFIGVPVDVGLVGALGQVQLADLLPIDPDTGDITLVTGDAYQHADGRSLDFSDPGTWPASLASATLIVREQGVRGTTPQLTLSGTIVAGIPRIARFELTASQTSALTPSQSAGDNAYCLQLLTPGDPGDLITVIPDGSCTITPGGAKS